MKPALPAVDDGRSVPTLKVEVTATNGDVMDSDQQEAKPSEPSEDYRADDGQEYLDRSQLDFDPDDGLLSGTVIDGTTQIPGPHERDEESEQPN
jgi:hypothetical protein